MRRTAGRSPQAPCEDTAGDPWLRRLHARQGLESAACCCQLSHDEGQLPDPRSPHRRDDAIAPPGVELDAPDPFEQRLRFPYTVQGTGQRRKNGLAAFAANPLILRTNNWSGRRDSNSRPLAPHASALPGCATPRQVDEYRCEQQRIRTSAGCGWRSIPAGSGQLRAPGLMRQALRPPQEPGPLADQLPSGPNRCHRGRCPRPHRPTETGR